MTGFELFTGESCSLSQLSLHMQGLLMGFALSLRTEKHTPPSGPDISSIAVFAGNFFSALQNITHTFTHEVSTTSEFAIRYLLALYLFRGDVSLANQAVNGQLPGMISNRCSTVFDKNDVFYRCQDCSSDETVVICAECFDASDHDGHNVTFYTDSTSGCCDCGDVTAWTRLPKCKIHTAAAGTESKNKLTADQSNYMMHAIHALLYFARDILLRHKIPRAHQYHDLTYFPRCKVPHYSQSEHRPSPYENLQRVAYTPPMHPSPNHYTMLYNNDINTFDQVIHFLESNRFIKSSEQGSAIAETIDEIGRAVIHISPVLPKDRLAQLANFAPLQASVTSQTQLQSELVVEILLSSLLQMCQSSACIRNATCRAFAEEYRPVPDSVFDELATITRRFRLLNSYLNTSVFLWKRVRNIILSLLLSTVIISNKRHLVITCMEFVISIPLLMNNLVLIDAETNFNIFYMITQIISCTEMTTLFRCQEWILSTLIPVFKKLPAGSKSRQRFNEMVHRAGDALSTPEAHRNVLDTKSLQIIIDLAGCMISQTVFTRRTTSHVEIENLEWPTVFNSIIHFSQLANAFINCFRSSTPLQRNELLRHIYKQLPMKDYDPLLNPDTGLLDHCISQQGVIVAIPLSWTFSKMVSAKAITSLEPIIAALWPSGDPSIHVQRTIHPPLAIFALSAQFNANLWRRNGSSFTEMLLYYRSSLLQENSSMGDLFLMQLAAAGLMDADVLVRQAAKHFGLLEWLLPGGVPPSRTRALSSGDDGEMSSLPPLLRPRAPPFDLDNTLALIEEFLIFLSALMTDRLAVAQQGDLHTYSDAICKLLLTQSIFSGIKRHSEIMSTLPSDFQSDPRSRALLASITELIPAEPGTAAASNPNAVAGNHCKLRNSWPMLGYFNPSNIHMCRMRRSRSAATVLGMMASLTPGDFVPASLPVPGLRVPGDKLLSTVTPAHYHSLLDARLDFLHEYQIRPALARLPASVAQCRKAQAGLPGLATPRGLQDFACNESLLAIVHSLLATFCVAYDASFARIPPPKRSGDTEALTSPSIIAQLLQLLADALALELVFAETEAGAGRGRRFAGLLTTLALPMSDIDLSESQRFSMPSLLRRYLARGSASQAGPSSPQGDATMANAEAPVIGPPGAGQLASSPATVVDLLAYVHFRLTHRDAPGAGPASASGPAAPADADAGLSQSADYTKLLGYMSWISAALDRLGLGECLTTAYAAVTAANDALLAEAGVGAASDSASSPALSAEEAQRRKEEERKLRWQRILDKQKASVSTFMANHEDLLKDGLFEDEAASAGVSDEEGLQVGPDAGAGPGAEPAAMRPVRDGIHPFFTFSRSNSCAVCREALTPAAPGGYIGLVQHSSLPRRQFAMLDVTAAPSVASSLLDSADMAATGPPTPRSIATAETGHQAACKRIDAHLAARLDPKAPASEQLVDVDLNQPWPVQRSWTPQQSNCFASTFTSPAGSFVSTCGHTIHFGCAAPLKRIQVDIAEPYQFLRCPVCQETSNTVLSLAAGPLIARQLPAVAPFHAWLATASGAGYDQLVDFHVGRTAFTQADLLPGHFAHLTKKHLTQWWTAQQPGHLLALFFEVLSLGPKVAATGPIPGHLLRPVAQDPTRAPGLAAYAQMVTATKAPGGPACRAPPVPAFPVPVVAAALTHQPLSPLVDDGFFFPQAMPDNIQSFRLRNLFPRVLACSVLAHTIRSVEAAQRGCRHPTTGLTLVDADGRAISRSGDITGLFLETIGLRDVLALRTALDTFALAALRTPLSLPALESNALALARMLSVGHHDMTNKLDRTTFLRVPALESVLLVCLMNRISELVFSLDLGQQSPAMGEVDPATAALLSRPLPADVFNWIRVFLLREVVKVTLRFVAEHPGQLSPVDAGSEPSFVEWLGPRSASVAAGAPSPGTVAGRALLAQDNAAVLGDLAGLISRVALGQDFAMGPGLSAKLLRLVRAYTLPLLRQFALLVFALLGVPVPVPDDSGDHPAAMSEWDLLARYLELPFDLRSLFDGGPGAGAGAGAGGSTDARCSVAAMEVDHVSAPLSDGVSQAITLSGHLVAAWVTAEATPPGGSAGVMSSDTGGGLSPGPVDAGRWEMMPVRQSPTVSPDPGYLPGRAAVLHLEHPFVYETVYLPQTLDRLLRLAGSPEYHCTSCSKPASSRATFCLLCGEVLCLRPGCRSPPTARFREGGASRVISLQAPPSVEDCLSEPESPAEEEAPSTLPATLSSSVPARAGLPSLAEVEPYWSHVSYLAEAHAPAWTRFVVRPGIVWPATPEMLAAITGGALPHAGGTAADHANIDSAGDQSELGHRVGGRQGSSRSGSRIFRHSKTPEQASLDAIRGHLGLRDKLIERGLAILAGAPGEPELALTDPLREDLLRRRATAEGQPSSASEPGPEPSRKRRRSADDPSVTARFEEVPGWRARQRMDAAVLAADAAADAFGKIMRTWLQARRFRVRRPNFAVRPVLSGDIPIEDVPRVRAELRARRRRQASARAAPMDDIPAEVADEMRSPAAGGTGPQLHYAPSVDDSDALTGDWRAIIACASAIASAAGPGGIVSHAAVEDARRLLFRLYGGRDIE
ncbi:hypothetical protein H696_03821 [Fonticula alba]|uniref:E3 ubiquitin-protein ligase n=1 Tax=Fonticula alba TaxID=691883 RepID=A0A058Z551_FONAL|nr:hypothetical protein H696_03821 [Fonticula alba]KCV69390.1 hypothetical protein H696_03821 [Fonticula alba]|eukprot:XP_009495955.1 hypothetical protein H696_03821 [Fonticula alba]